MKDHAWKVTKDLHNTMTIDFKKKTIRCSKTAWFKFERKHLLHIFALEVSKK